MQFIDLAAQQQRIRDRINSRIQTVLDHGRYVMGPEVGELEKRLAESVGVAQCIGCASGTDALLMALMAYDIGPGDAVFTTPFTFVATAEVIRLLGATPVFTDIDPRTFNLDPVKLDRAIARFSSPLTPKGIIAVDLFGLPANYEAINAIAGEYGLFVIEDAAQSFGARFQGKTAGGLADMACTSFFPAKPLGAYGDGGAVFTDSREMAEKLRSIRVHGQGENKYDNVRIGINGRLDTLQAAILLAKLEIFPEELERRQAVAARYSEGLADQDMLLAPFVPPEKQSAWAQYSVLAHDETHRRALQEKLKAGGVPTAIYYPRPLHLQPAFFHLPYKAGDFPVAEETSRRIFSLPMHPYLSRADQQTVLALLHG